MILETARLRVRDWRDEDIPLYADVLGDPIVRRYFVETGTLTDARIAIERARERLVTHGFSMLALERREDGQFLGLVGMAPLSDELKARFAAPPPVEIGWQLDRRFWGQGYAPEAARAWIDYGFGQLGLPEIGAVTYVGNAPSRRVMEKLGMRHDPADDFEHPAVPEGHRLRPHVLYRIARPTAA